MRARNSKELFDKAYSHLQVGEINDAAACFQYIISNVHTFGQYAARIAQQRILWYCVPLDIIFSEMEQNEFPTDILSTISTLLISDVRYNDSDIEPLLKTIEDHLKKMPVCTRVGKYFWIYREFLEKLAGSVALNLENTAVPVSLEAIFKKEWSEYCRNHPTFPDHDSETALTEIFQNLRVKVLRSKYVFSDSLLPTALDAFGRMIVDAGQPLCLKKQIPKLFPSLSDSTEGINIFENYLTLHLDNRFIECIPGYYLTRKLLKFDTTSFDDLYTKRYLSFPSIHFIRHCFPNADTTKLTTAIITLVQSQLLSNPHLVQVGEGTWISRSCFDSIHRDVIQTLSDQCDVVPIKFLLDQVAPPGMNKNQLKEFKTIILASLQSDNQAIQITNVHWLHKRKIKILIDKAYNYLLEHSQATLDKIVMAVLNDIDLPNPLHSFQVAFEEYLSNDPRFSVNPNNRKNWRVIPKGQRDNDSIYYFLYELSYPLYEEEIMEKLQLKEPEYDLVADSRFQSFPTGRWGLSTWVWLNDYVYEYLLSTGQALHQNVVIGLVCKEHGFRRKNAFFLPEGDPRFAQDSLNRWFSRYKLKKSDLDRLLEELDHYSGIGRKLDLLFQKVLRLHPDATNACEVLPSDPRFIHLDDLWYSQRMAFRVLSLEDLERVYTYLSGLPIDSPVISIRDVGIKALGWDGRLTNASDLLAKDDRYVERHPGHWALSTWLSPDYDRTTQGGVTVRGTTSFTEPDDDLLLEIYDRLTKRGYRWKTKSKQDSVQNKVYHTLSHLDILHGNIRISRLLKKWISETAKTIILLDDEANELVAYIDEAHTILNIRDWIQKRGLTYGDKIFLEPGGQPDSLFIKPYGKRDERVYQEAIEHQDIEKLIAEARRVNMTYHDLMIEVMKAFDFALHREDIFQLVDYQRTAIRNTVFETLSLTDCPYEELRYFIPKGNGYWSFDRQRKKAFDMKMKELIDENASLKGQNAILLKQKEDERDITARYSDSNEKVEYLEQSIQALNAEKTSLLTRIQELEEEKSLSDKFLHRLNENLAQAQQNLTELTDAHARTVNELELLSLEQQTFQEKENQLQTLKDKSKIFSIQIRHLSEELETRTATVQELEKRLVVAHSENATIRERFSAEWAQIIQQVSMMKNQQDMLSQTNAELIRENAHLSSRLKQIDLVLGTPLGRLFAMIQGLKVPSH